MATKIEWTRSADGTPGETWNPTTGCTHAGPECDNCYAVPMSARLEAMGQEKYKGLTVINGKGNREFNGVVRTHDDVLSLPLKWRKPRMIFVNSMSDLFHRDVPFEFIDQVFAVMALCPQHTFQVLTKRPERMAEYMNDSRDMLGFKTDERVGSEMTPQVANAHPVDLAKRFKYPMQSDMQWPLPNVWLGFSAGTQKMFDDSIQHMLKVPAAVRWVSLEPLLEAVDIAGGLRISWQCGGCRNYFSGKLREVCPTCKRDGYWSGSHAFNPPGGQTGSGIDWVVVGGESGPHARPAEISWYRDIRDQCRAAGIPYFQKQLGKRVRMKFEDWNAMLGDTDNHNFTLDGPGCDDGEFCPRDPKGGSPEEWPADLRVREFPSPS